TEADAAIAGTCRIVHLVILLEDIVLLAWADADAAILDDDPHAIATFLAPQRHRSFMRVLDCVGDEVAQYAFDPQRIRAYPQIGVADSQLDAFGLRFAAIIVIQAAEQPS